MEQIDDATRELFRFRDMLTDLGLHDETVAETIRICGARLPIFCTQLKGQYIRHDGRRECHFAVPGWYRLLKIGGLPSRATAFVIQKEHPGADRFIGWHGDLKMCLGANIEYVEKGLDP